jgi:phage recombination protein Bet
MSSNELMVSKDESLNKALSMWNDKAKLEEIRKIYAPKLSDDEFKTFVEMGISCGLNPFLREIWAVKYEQSSPAQIFIGRDGYRKIISRNNSFKGIIVDSVCANDEFNVDVVKGEVKHVPRIKDRGKLIGAYCIIYMHNSVIPYYVFVPIEEYNTGRSVWKDKPHTMIKKVAECQCIRMADQTCASTYSPDEMPDHLLKDGVNKAEALNAEYSLVTTKETINPETGEVKPAKVYYQAEVTGVGGAGSGGSTPLQPQETSSCPFTFEEVLEGFNKADSLNKLAELASLISQMEITPEQRAQLTKAYRDQKKELEKQ